MKIKKILTTLIGIICCAFTTFAQQINFYQTKSAAGKSSLTSDSYYSEFTLGIANFSPELKYPIQISYDSAEKNESLLGVSWTIPQLESSIIPNKDGAIWTAPWGEKVSFLSRKNTDKEVLKAFNETEHKNAFFSPFADWSANGNPENGSWTIFGRNDMQGWKFSYIASKLRKIEAPSGLFIEFTYSNGRPVSISQNGKSFVEIKYSNDKTISEILINGVSRKFEFAEGNIRILPETLSGKLVNEKVLQLKKVVFGTFNPIEFSYNAEGYLTQIKRGNFVDDIEVSIETFEDRLGYLKKLADAVKSKKPTNKIFKEIVDGRIAKDSFFTYEYPTSKIGDVKITNKLGQVASYSYDYASGIFKTTDFAGKGTTTYFFMRYDVAYNGKVRQIVDSQNRILANYRYDKDSGKPTRYRDIARNDINFKYDSKGRLVSISKRGANDENALSVRSFNYEKSTTLPSQINELDENGNAVKTTSISYDKSLRITEVSDGANSVKVSYNKFGYPVRFVNSFGQETLISYDEFNRQISRESNGIKIHTIYNENGLIEKEFSEFNGEILNSVEIAYNADAYAVSYKDQYGLVKKFTKDELGRTLQEIFPDNTRAEYAYDELGNLAQVIDQNGNKIKFAWNEFGLDSRTTAVGQITQNRYDFCGRLAGVESRFEGGKSARTIRYFYDEFDRIDEVLYGENEVETRKYDTWGRLIELNKNGLRSSFKYDHFGRLVEKAEGDSATKYA